MIGSEGGILVLMFMGKKGEDKWGKRWMGRGKASFS